MTNEISIFTEMEQYALANNIPIIDTNSGKLLAHLVKLYQPRNVLEIGTAIGYSTLLIAANMPPKGRIITLEIEESRAQIANNNIVKANLPVKVAILVGNAGVILPNIEGKFDMVFIDAAKGQYYDYLEKVIDKLADGAVVIADNVLFRGYVESNDVPRRFRTIVRNLKKYLDAVNNNQLFETVVHRTGDGLAVSVFKGANNK